LGWIPQINPNQCPYKTDPEMIRIRWGIEVGLFCGTGSWFLSAIAQTAAVVDGVPGVVCWRMLTIWTRFHRAIQC